MTHRPLKLALIGSTLALLAGCNNSSDASPSMAANNAPTTTIVTTTATSPTSTTTTSTTTTTTVAPAPTSAPPPTISIPARVPRQDEIINIVNEWNRRVNAMYASPNINTVNELCTPNSDCSREFTAQITDIVDRGEHVEGRNPATVAYLRSVVATDDGGFIVSFWSDPVDDGFLVGPSETLHIPRVTDGIGETLAFVPYPANPEFPWRVSDELTDPK